MIQENEDSCNGFVNFFVAVQPPGGSGEFVDDQGVSTNDHREGC